MFAPGLVLVLDLVVVVVIAVVVPVAAVMGQRWVHSTASMRPER